MAEDPRPKHKLRVPRPKKGAVTLLIGTRKGAFALKSDAERGNWGLRAPWFLGSVVHHVVMDPRDGKTVLAAARSGPSGSTIFRSEDKGKTWRETRKPPAFDAPKAGFALRTINHVFWLTPGHESEAGTWYAGSSPQGLFRSRDGGKTWRPVNGLNQHPLFDTWTGAGQDATPDGPKLHSILVDPRDAAHLYVGMSNGGVFESTDTGRNWSPLNEGCEVVQSGGKQAQVAEHEGPPDFGHDPHHVVAARSNPDRLWQQNHCGIYRMDREDGRWIRVGKNLPKRIGDAGFPIVVSPFDPDCAWVFPMDGADSWSRTPPAGSPAVWRTQDAGASWLRQDRGLPRDNAWWTVKRQCMDHDQQDPLGLYLGTASGEVWASLNAGRSWHCIARHLPHIYSIEVARTL